jgi:hypothetical protein
MKDIMNVIYVTELELNLNSHGGLINGLSVLRYEVFDKRSS